MSVDENRDDLIDTVDIEDENILLGTETLAEKKKKELDDKKLKLNEDELLYG